MKTSLDLPDDLYRQLKARSALEGRTVREVATALFAAWVDGRVELEGDSGSSPTTDRAPVADLRQAWLARWRSLSDQVAHAVAQDREPPADVTPAATTSLVDGLLADRR